MTESNLRQRSRILAHLVTMVFVLLLFAAAVELAAVARGRFSRHYLALRLALPFYLWAIWSVRRMILAVGQGAGHDRPMAAMLRRTGVSLFLGGICAVFVAPLVARAIRGGGPFAYYDVAAITIGVIGLALLVVAHLLGQAADMRRELDEIL